jgi:hypothetical protein
MACLCGSRILFGPLSFTYGSRDPRSELFWKRGDLLLFGVGFTIRKLRNGLTFDARCLLKARRPYFYLLLVYHRSASGAMQAEGVGGRETMALTSCGRHFESGRRASRSSISSFPLLMEPIVVAVGCGGGPAASRKRKSGELAKRLSAS